jgi:nicotinate-nucleotide adenylyltransferase
VPALKSRQDLADAAHRTAMVRLATADHAGFQVLDLELRRAGPSYSVDTVRELRKEWGDGPLWFLLGTDVLPSLDQWHEVEQLLGLTSLAVASRVGTQIGRLADCMPRALARQYTPDPEDSHLWHHASGQQLRWFQLESLDIASSQVRALIGEGRSARYLVPDSVLAYIQEHGLYRENA